MSMDTAYKDWVAHDMSCKFNATCKVVDMPEHNTGDMGGTMRLGKRVTKFVTENSVLWKLYNRQTAIEERHWHRYEVNRDYVADLETGERMEILELKGHPYFVAVQYHPEYISQLLQPSPPYLGLVLASCAKLVSYLNKVCRFSPRYGSDISSDEDSDIEKESVAEAEKESLAKCIAKSCWQLLYRLAFIMHISISL